jgi:hypothetical protein
MDELGLNSGLKLGLKKNIFPSLKWKNSAR